VAKRAAELTANGDGRAQVITLALVLGALEAHAQGRLAPHRNQPVVPLRQQRRLSALAGRQRLPLAAVEQVVTGAKDSEGVYSEFCT
jgi:ParB family transcriptional regulator, chromosome partitioning protein